MAGTSMIRQVERSGRALLEELWAGGSGGASRFRRALIHSGRVAYITVEGFISDLCMLRASALTFASLMGLVPVLALLFSILRGLGWRGDRLEEMILSKATLLSPDAISVIVSYIDKTNFAGLGAVGGSVLFLTFVSVLTNIEGSLNAIWGNVSPRPLARRIMDYFGVMVIAPVLLAVATSLTAAVQSNVIVQRMTTMWGVGPTFEYMLRYAAQGVVWVLFGFLYKFIPNTPVRIVPAIVGGVLAGSIWQITQWAYIRFQIGMANYNAIYGALAQLPLLMAWVYISWLIVLLGAEIAFAVQNVGSYSRDRRVSSSSGYSLREYAGLRVIGELATAAEGNRPAPQLGPLAVDLDMPARLVREIVQQLSAAGLAHVTDGDDERCYLSLAPERIPVNHVLDVLRGNLPGGYAGDHGDADHRVHELLGKLKGSRDETLASLTVRDLAG